MAIHTIEEFRELAAGCTRAAGIARMVDDCGQRIVACPSSTKYHGCYAGGWLDHTVEVARLAQTLAKTLKFPRPDSVLFSALCHDLGKLGEPGRDGRPLYVAQPDKGAKDPYTTNRAILPYQHELRSLHWLAYYNVLYSEEEMIAVVHHAGAYNPAHTYLGEDSRHPLLMLVHAADNLVAKVVGV